MATLDNNDIGPVHWKPVPPAQQSLLIAEADHQARRCDDHRARAAELMAVGLNEDAKVHHTRAQGILEEWIVR